MTLTRAALALIVLFAGIADAQRGRGQKKAPRPKAPAPAPAPAPPPEPTPAPRVKKAPTGKERIVGILDVRGPTEADEATFEQSLEDELDTATWWLAPREIMQQRLHNSTKWTEGCLVHTCLQEVKVQTGADLVVLAALTGSGTSFGFVVTVLRTDNGTVVAQESQRCDVCTFKETMTAAVKTTATLLNTVPSQLPVAEAPDVAVDRAVQKAVEPLEKQLAAARKQNRRGVGIALTLVGLAVAGGGAAWYFLDDENELGLAMATAGGGLAVGGVTVMAF